MSEMERFQARQGDIFFRAIEKMPMNMPKHTTPTIAEGEVTGHVHKVVNFDDVDILVGESGELYLKSKTGKDVEIEHDEHGTVTLPGDQIFCITHQREYDALAEEKERQVAD